jgi:hypothetical protein
MYKLLTQNNFKIEMSIPKTIKYNKLLIWRMDRIFKIYHSICAEYENTKKRILKNKDFSEPIVDITICRQSNDLIKKYIEEMKLKC